MKKVRKAIIPAAGLGTRFLPATKALPKEMLPILDKPTIQYIVEEAAASGIEEILIVISNTKNSIMDHFDYSFEIEYWLNKKGKKDQAKKLRKIADIAKIQYIRQKEPLGLGDAILSAKSFIGNEYFAVLLGDDVVVQSDNSKEPALLQCIEAHKKTHAPVIGIQKVDESQTPMYGIVDVDKKYQNDKSILKLNGFVEKPKLGEAPSNYAILGRYVLSPQIFNELENVKVDASGEIQLTSAIRSLSESQVFYGKIFEGKRYDIGSKVGYVEAIIHESLKNDETKDQVREIIKKIKLGL
ncbi:MAG: UTP--glucose-1-phosphate uridylyltransferase GalU [Mycoplasmoidaceae bacterium]